LYYAIEPEVEHERYRSYREVLTETAVRVSSSLGWSLEAEHVGFLTDSLPAWPPFADTNAALARLANAGFTLGILSNVDDDLIATTRRHFSVDFSLVITAQQVCSYKPAPAHFLAAREQLGNARWLHAAQSAFHDIAPTNALGIPNAWVNRLGETAAPDEVPTIEVRDLASLADRLLST
jgi:2-haloalkanoic acid dehalogenase type II